MVRKGVNLKDLLKYKLEPEDLAWDHAMDISASVYSRMEELGLMKKELASEMGVSPSQVSKILKGEQSMTLKTLAKLEVALDLDLSSGFVYRRKDIDRDYEQLIRSYSQPRHNQEEKVENRKRRVVSTKVSIEEVE